MKEFDEIPHEVAEAASRVSKWAIENHHECWELFSICSRNHAAIAEELAYHLGRYQARYHGAPHAIKPWEEAELTLQKYHRMKGQL